MAKYIDGFVFPLPAEHIEEYQTIAETIAKIWKEHGALSYSEFVGDDLTLEGTLPFPDLLQVNEGELIIFGWLTFESKESRDEINKLVANDARMPGLMAPLINPSRIIFDASKMAYAGFRPLLQL